MPIVEAPFDGRGSFALDELFGCAKGVVDEEAATAWLQARSDDSILDRTLRRRLRGVRETFAEAAGATRIAVLAVPG